MSQEFLKRKEKGMSGNFEDIKIIGIDKKLTNKPEPSKEIYHVYFELSAEPPEEWEEIFESARKFPRHSMWRYAWVEGNYIVVQCPLEEVEKYHLRDIKEDVLRSNKEYKEEFSKQETKAEHQSEINDMEEKKKNDVLDRLKFD